MTPLLLLAALTITASPARLVEPSPVQTLRVALVSDTHVRTDDTAEARAYHAHLVETIKQVNAARVDVVVITGDLTESGKPAQYDAFSEQTQGFAAPVRVVPGNHDVGAKHLPSKPGEGVTQKRVDEWEKRFGPSFWVYSVKGTRIIGLNTPVLGSGLSTEAAQWQFLEAQLTPSGSSPAVFVQHYPLFLQTPEEAGGDYWNVEPAPRAKYLALLDKASNVRAVLSGHLHRPLAVHYKNVPCIGTPPVSFGLPKNHQPEGWTLVTIASTGEASSEFHAVTSAAGQPTAAMEKKP